MSGRAGGRGGVAVAEEVPGILSGIFAAESLRILAAIAANARKPSKPTSAESMQRMSP